MSAAQDELAGSADPGRAEPTYLNGGPFDGSVRMVPESHTFMLVEQKGMYEIDGKWGALRQFSWKEAQRV